MRHLFLRGHFACLCCRTADTCSMFVVAIALFSQRKG